MRLPLIVSLAVLTSCSKSMPEDVVTKTYHHRYGMEIPENSWEEAGETGVVITKQKDGITVQERFSDGKRHGKTTHSFSHRQAVEKEFVYDQDELREMTIYKLSGRPQKKISYLPSGEQHVVEWFDEGTPKCKETRLHQRILSAEYYNTEYQVESSIDQGQGTKIVRDDFGELLAHESYEEGDLRVRKIFYPNGNIKEETQIVDQLPHGVRSLFSSNGQLQEQQHFVAGVQEGSTLIYEQGELLRIVPYFQGYPHGMEQIFNEQGQTVAQMPWVMGQKEGRAVSFIDGIEVSRWYYQDQEVSKAMYDQLTRVRS